MECRIYVNPDMTHLAPARHHDLKTFVTAPQTVFWTCEVLNSFFVTSSPPPFAFASHFPFPTLQRHGTKFTEKRESVPPADSFSFLLEKSNPGLCQVWTNACRGAECLRAEFQKPTREKLMAVSPDAASVSPGTVSWFVYRVHLPLYALLTMRMVDSPMNFPERAILARAPVQPVCNFFFFTRQFCSVCVLLLFIIWFVVFVGLVLCPFQACTFWPPPEINRGYVLAKV